MARKNKLYPFAKLHNLTNSAAQKANETGTPIKNLNENQITKRTTRPTYDIKGNPTSRDQAVDITNLSPEERQKQQDASRIIGLAGQKEAIAKGIIERVVKMSPEEKALPSIEEMKSQIPESMVTPGINIGETAKKIISPDLNPKPNPEGLSKLERLKEPIPMLKKSIAQIYDALYSSVTRKEPLTVAKSKQTFAEVTGAIQQNIANVQNGVGDYVEARRDFDTALASLNELESTTKGLGKENLNYWIDNGAEIEATIIRERAILENLRNDLEVAKVNKIRSQLKI
jgi:hypothetical protein